jgi:hypothetical protein
MLLAIKPVSGNFRIIVLAIVKYGFPAGRSQLAARYFVYLYRVSVTVCVSEERVSSCWPVSPDVPGPRMPNRV